MWSSPRHIRRHSSLEIWLTEFFLWQVTVLHSPVNQILLLFSNDDVDVGSLPQAVTHVLRAGLLHASSFFMCSISIRRVARWLFCHFAVADPQAAPCCCSLLLLLLVVVAVGVSIGSTAIVADTVASCLAHANCSAVARPVSWHLSLKGVECLAANLLCSLAWRLWLWRFVADSFALVHFL